MYIYIYIVPQPGSPLGSYLTYKVSVCLSWGTGSPGALQMVPQDHNYDHTYDDNCDHTYDQFSDHTCDHDHVHKCYNKEDHD